VELTDLYVCIAEPMADKTGARSQRELVDVAFAIEAAALKGFTREERLRNAEEE
jgi:hypothetical protein